MALIFGVALFTLQSCKPEVKNNTGFDLAGYFKKDAARLKKLNRPVIKTVKHNGVSETKTVHIADWEQEFGFFIEADINKPALVNSYNIITGDSLLMYKAKERNMKVQELIMKKDGKKIKYFLIYTRVENALYKTSQKLTYFPDSLYRVETTQKVRLLGGNYDAVEGLIQ
jgi:hypothetical protein